MVFNLLPRKYLKGPYVWYSLTLFHLFFFPLFFRDEMRNAFNLLLISLLGFDSWFLFGCILENVRRNFDLASNLHTLLFPYFLYPTANVAMSGSIFMTVAISLERYFAVHHPIGEFYSCLNITYMNFFKWTSGKY